MSLCPLASLGGESPETALRPQRIRWSKVTLAASKFGLTTVSEIELRRAPVSRAALELLKPEGVAPLQPRGRNLIVMRLKSSFLGIQSDTRFWLDPRSARAFQWIVVESGRRERFKASRFLPDGAWVLRKDPGKKAEKGRPHNEWSNVRSRIEHYPGWTPDQPVTDSAGLFYIVAAAPLEAVGDQVHAFVTAQDKVHRIEIRLVETGQVKVNFSLHGPEGHLQVKGMRDGLHLSLRPRPPEGADPREFQLIGLQGDIDLWLDAENRFPLEIVGRIAYAGKVKIRLQQATLWGSWPSNPSG